MMSEDFKTRLAMANYYQEIADGGLFGDAADDAAQILQEDIQEYARAKLAEMFGEASSPPPRRVAAPAPAPAPVRRQPQPQAQPARQALLRAPKPAVAQAPVPARPSPPQRTTMLSRIKAPPV